MSSPAAAVAFWYRQTHERVLRMLDDLSDEQFIWRPVGSAHSIAFNVWHLARWADHLQAHLSGMATELREHLGPGQQLWVIEGLGPKWGFAGAGLGHHETGMLMDEEAVARLPMPRKEVVLDYARRAFDAAERAVALVDDDLFPRPQEGKPDETIGGAILSHLTHDSRHLGEIEFLRGLQGLRGTATQ